MADLTLRDYAEGGVSVLVVCGELDLFSGPRLDHCLADLAARGSRRVVLDVLGLTFCDAAGLRILCRGEARARALDGWLRLARVDWRVRRVLEIVGVTELLPVFASVADAVAGTVADTAARHARSNGVAKAGY